MAPPIIKQLGTQPSMTVEQRRRERDLIDQVNRRAAAQDGTLAELGALADVLRLIGKPIVMGRTVTDGAGGFTSRVLRGGTASLSAGRLRITFDKPRPRDPGTNQPRYVPWAMALTGGFARFYTATNITSTTFCDFVCRNDAGGEVSHATNPLVTALAIFDAD